MGLRFWERGILMLVLWGRLTCAVVAVRFPLCPTESITDSIFRFQDSFCPISSNDFQDIVGVIDFVALELSRGTSLLEVVLKLFMVNFLS
ncbi:hypothetical protein AB3S75_048030 [Citrus x aurantiifolia]